MMGGLVALIFVMLIIVIIFLMFQINDNSNRCSESKTAQQERLTKAARLIVQSSTQQHPLFAHEHALEAKILIDDIVNQNGGIILAERHLKIPRGRLDNLRQQVYQQYQDIQTLVMDKIIEKHPELNLDINEEAGLRKKRKRKRKQRE